MPPNPLPQGGEGRFDSIFIALFPLGERVDRRQRFRQPGRAG